MASHRQNRQQRGKRSKAPRRAAASLTAHRAFAPLLGLWGLLLGGLVVLVLPAALIAGLVSETLLAAMPELAQPLVAIATAMVMGGAIYTAAALMNRRARRTQNTPSVLEVAGRRIQPINPVRDLGIGSLDDPVVAAPFSVPPAPQPGPAEPAPAPPRELDLGEFAALPGRDAVWVEEATPAPVAVLHRAGGARAEATGPGAAALARLRALPPSELSLAEMVERFAGAMHEQRHSPARKALSPQDLAAREAALAEALKALAALSSKGAPAHEDKALHAALSRLQGLRGVA